MNKDCKKCIGYHLMRVLEKDTQNQFIVEKILEVASDKKSRFLMEDQCEWLETKLKGIKELANVLPHQGRKLINPIC